MEYLAFEKPIEELTKKLEKAKELGLDKAISLSCFCKRYPYC